MTARSVKPLSSAARLHLVTLERQWSGSLQLGMLATPLRKCVVTSKVLPTSLMVLLKAVHLPPPPPPPSSPTQSPAPALPARGGGNSTARNDNDTGRGAEGKVVMLPDRILHPKYVPRKVGKGLWVTLDASVWGHLQKRGLWKVLHPKATLPVGLEHVLTRQLAERVVQEAALLAERFRGRKRLDLLTTTTTTTTSTNIELDQRVAGSTFTVLLHPSKDREATLGPHPIFAPTFVDQDQTVRFTAAVHALLTPALDPAEIYAVAAKQSSITAPLGIALYRLHLWCASVAREKEAAATATATARR